MTTTQKNQNEFQYLTFLNTTPASGGHVANFGSKLLIIVGHELTTLCFTTTKIQGRAKHRLTGVHTGRQMTIQIGGQLLFCHQRFIKNIHYQVVNCILLTSVIDNYINMITGIIKDHVYLSKINRCSLEEIKFLVVSDPALLVMKAQPRADSLYVTWSTKFAFQP